MPEQRPGGDDAGLPQCRRRVAFAACPRRLHEPRTSRRAPRRPERRAPSRTRPSRYRRRRRTRAPRRRWRLPRSRVARRRGAAGRPARARRVAISRSAASDVTTPPAPLCVFSTETSDEPRRVARRWSDARARTSAASDRAAGRRDEPRLHAGERRDARTGEVDDVGVGVDEHLGARARRAS